MPRKKTGPELRMREIKTDFADKLAAELKDSKEYGQPLIFEETYRTGKVRVNVIWDAWYGMPLQLRSATILRAYEIAEGAEFRDRIALASGLTVPEAYAAGMLPYQIIAAVRKGDPVTLDQAREALLQEGGSQLFNSPKVQLRFTTEEDAQAARQRLIERFPASDDVWIITGEMTTQDLGKAQDWAQVEQE
jgi:hypothetical protein